MLGVIIACLFGVRADHPKLNRPLDTDEILTLRYYTWAGLDPSATPHHLNHISEFRSLPAPTGLQLAAGLYCSLGRWPEPNNQLLNSALVGLVMALEGRSERALRLPALVGSLVFAGAMYVLCGPILGWRSAAPLVAVWAWFLPYVIQFGMTARGYSWMLALQVIQIILAYRLAHSRRPLVLGVLGASVAIVLILNVVSMSVDWVLPFYLALFLARPGNPSAEQPDRSSWRRSVMAQFLAVVGMGAIFLMSHLAAVYSSAKQYGIPFHSLASFFEAAAQILGELFPTFLDQGLALAGLCGIVAMALARRHRFLVLLCALTFGISLLHYAASGRFPYARATAHIIPILLIGATYLADAMIQVYEHRAGRVAMFGMLAAFTAIFAWFPRPDSLNSLPLETRLELARESKISTGSKVYLPIRESLDSTVAFYAPEEWDQVNVVEPDQELTIVSLIRVGTSDGSGPGFPMINLFSVSGRTRPMSDEDVDAGSWIFWYPDFLRLGLDASEQRSFVKDSGCPHLTQTDRFLVKFDVFSNVRCFIFIPESRLEASRCREVVREAIRRFGGSAVVFVPSTHEPSGR